MSKKQTTHLGLKIDTKELERLMKMLKPKKSGDELTNIIARLQILDESIKDLNKGGLGNIANQMSKDTEDAVRGIENLIKANTMLQRGQKSRMTPYGRTVGTMDSLVIKDYDTFVMSMQSSANLLKGIFDSNKRHLETVGAITEHSKEELAIIQAKAKLIRQQILDDDRILQLQEQKERAEKDLLKLEEGSLEYNEKKLEVLESDVRLRKEKHKLLRKENVDVLDEREKKNYEGQLKASRANVLNAENLVKAQKKQIKNQQKLTKEVGKTKRGFGAIIKDFFSLEKLIARMSFVLTAKLSYELFDTFARMPKDAIRLWREFSDEISKTFALIAGESDKTKKRLQSDIIELSKTYGIAAKELSGALYEIISAQAGVANASRVLNEAIKLSLAGGADVRTAAQSLVQIINAYELGFDQVQRVADVAFQTVKYGQLTLQQYTDQMSKVVATASLLKIPIEEVSAAIATMTINGIKSEQAFTALNQMLMTIAIPTERSKELMEQLGINLSISDIQAKGMGAALSELIPMLSMTGEANEELIGILFKNRTGFKAVASLLQNMGQYTENYARMIDSAGTSHEALAQRMNTVEFHANKLRTTWDAFLMSFAEGRNRQIIGFYEKMANGIKVISNNLDLVFMTIKMIIATIAIQLIRKTLPLLKTAFLSIKKVVTGVGTAFKTAWAEATLGLSLLISLIANAIIMFRTFAQRARDASMDSALGISKINNEIKTLSSEVDKLDRAIGQMDSVIRLVNQFENLYNAQKNVVGSQDKITQGFNAMTMGLQAVGIDIKNITLDTLNFVDIMDAVLEHGEKLTKQRIKFQTMLSLRESQAMYGDAKTSIGVTPKRRTPNHVPYYVPDIDTMDRRVGALLLDVASDTDEKKIMGEITALIDILEAESERLLSLPTYDALDEFSQKAVDESIGYFIGLTNKLHGIKMIRSFDAMTSFDFNEKEKKQIGRKKESEFSDKLKSILQRLIGDRVFESLEEVQEAVNEELDAIKDEMRKFEKDKGVITDKKQAEEFIKLIEGMVSEGVMVDVVKARDEYLEYQIDTMKKMREAGKEQDAFTLFEESIKTWDDFNDIISASIDKIDDFSGKMSESDSRNLKNNLEKSVLGNPIEMLVAIGEVLSPKEYLKLISERIPKEFGLPEQGISSLKELDVLMAEAEDAGMTGFANILQLFKEVIIRGLESALELDLNITPEDEAFNVVKSVIAKGMAQGKIASVSDLNKAIADVESQGVILDKSQKTELRKMLGGGWKDVLGVEEYEKEHDATIDIAKKTVATLSQVWDFYWDMELRKMQEQQDKKLKILEHEKDMMLANTNLSNEQRVVLEQRYQEEQERLREEFEKKSAKQKKKKAIYDATIDYAKGLISLWSADILNPIKAGVLSALLSGIFATQMAMINNQKFASGGFTGAGYGRPDETGHKPAGIVHAGELVFTKDMVDKNFAALSGLFSALRAGKSFDAYAMGHIAGSAPMIIKPSKSRSYASGGLVGGGLNNISISLGGIRTIDDVDLAKIVARGSRKMRFING